MANGITDIELLKTVGVVIVFCLVAIKLIAVANNMSIKELFKEFL